MTNRLDNVIDRNRRLRFADVLFIVAIAAGIGGALTAVGSQASKQVSLPSLNIDDAQFVDASDCQPSATNVARLC